MHEIKGAGKVKAQGTRGAGKAGKSCLHEMRGGIKGRSRGAGIGKGNSGRGRQVIVQGICLMRSRESIKEQAKGK